MTRLIFSVFLLILFIIPSAQAESRLQPQIIGLTQEEDIEDIKLLRRAQNRLAESIKQCQEDEPSRIKCTCKSKSEIKYYSRVLKSILRKNPEWEENVTFYRVTNGEKRTNIFISLISHQRYVEALESRNCR